MRWLERLTLAAIVTAGAFLRFFHLGRVSLWLDEILSYDIASAAAHHWWRGIFTTFEPEHGPLFHASLLAGRLMQSPEWSARLAAALFGTITIVVVWRVAGLAAALLMAVAPLNVYYSRDGRPYALLMLVTALLLLALVRGWRPRWIFLLSSIAAYTSAVAAPVIAAAFVSAVAAALLSGDGETRRRYLRSAAAIAAASFLILLLYRGGSSEQPRYDVTIGLDSLVQGFSVRTIDTGDRSRVAWVVAALALIGAIELFRRDRRRAVIVLLMTIGPAALGLAVLVGMHHWYSLRYVCAALPGYLVLAGSGIVAVAEMMSALARRSVPRLAAAITAIVAIALSAAMLPAARSEAYQKLDWRLIASTIWRHAHPGDMVIATNDWSAISLGFYLKRLPPRVRMITTGESAGAVQALTSRSEPAWIVAGGYYRSNMFPQWFCRFPLLLASPLDSFGLHYSPSRSDFLRERALPAERRAIAAAVHDAPFTIAFGAGDEALLGEGWAGRERLGGDDMRWVMGTEASLYLPFDESRAHRIRMHITPFDAAGLPPQTMQVFAGDVAIASVTLSPGWQEYQADVPPRSSHELRFRFSRANAPASLDRNATDRRPLSALFSEVSVDTPTPVPAGPFALSVRAQEMDADGRPMYLNEHDARRNRKSQFDPRRYDRGGLAALAGRSGFDPDFAVPRLLDGRLTIEDLADSVLDRAGCLDDVAFVRNTYWSIIGRPVTEEDALSIVKPWKSANARRRLVQGLIESSEFAGRMKGRARRAE